MKKWYAPIAVFLVTGLMLLLLPLPGEIKALLYKTYNLVLFLYIIYNATAPAVRTFFIQRKQQIEQHILEARSVKEQAEKLLESYQEKIKTLEQEKGKILARYQQEGNREREIIIEEDHREATRIIQQAQDLVNNEARKVQHALREEIITASLRLSEELLKQHYNQEDQHRAIEEALVRVRDLRL